MGIRKGYEGRFQGAVNVLFLDLEVGYMMTLLNIHKLYTLNYNFLYVYFKIVLKTTSYILVTKILFYLIPGINSLT